MSYGHKTPSQHPVAAAVGKAQPEVIVHQLTALAGWGMRNLKRGAAITNRLRIEGTDHLLAVGQAVGVRRFVAQSNYLLGLLGGIDVIDPDAGLLERPPEKLLGHDDPPRRHRSVGEHIIVRCRGS